MTSGSLLNYCRYEVNDDENENDSKFVIRKWNIVNDHSNANYDAGNEIVHKTEVLKSNLCNSNDAYILVKGTITTIWHQVTQFSI